MRKTVMIIVRVKMTSVSVLKMRLTFRRLMSTIVDVPHR